MLSDSQLTLFNTFGFVVLRGFLTTDEIDMANAEFDIGLAAAEREMQRSGIRGQLNWSNLRPETLSRPDCSRTLGSLGLRRRYWETAQWGRSPTPTRSTATAPSGIRTWTSRTGTESSSASICSRWMGAQAALRLIPGSHKEPLHSDLKSVEMMESNDGAKNGTGLSVEQVPAFHARSEPGDVVLFDNHTWHASYGGSKDRRMCTVGYFASPTTPEEVVAVRFGAEQSANLARTFPRLRRHPDWVANPGGSRVRQGWIDTLRRWGFLDDGES